METAVAQICESNAKHSEVNNLRNEIQLLKFQLDRQNQYSRRDSGIPETEDENTNDIVKKLAADIDMTLTQNEACVFCYGNVFVFLHAVLALTSIFVLGQILVFCTLC